MSQTNLTISGNNGGSLSLTINDAFDLILKSPQVTQLFARAVARVATNFVGGAVSEIIVTIGQNIDRVDYQLYGQKLELNIAKLDKATSLCAKAVIDNEANPNIPENFKREYKARLETLFFGEMEKLVPSRR